MLSVPSKVNARSLLFEITPFHHFNSVHLWVVKFCDRTHNKSEVAEDEHAFQKWIISGHFKTLCAQRYHNPDSYDFWMWCYLKKCCIHRFDCQLSWIKNTHSATHSQFNHWYNPICCGTCCFSISTCVRECWTAYWTFLEQVSRPLKNDFIVVFSEVFVLGAIKNQFHCRIFSDFWPN